MRDEPLRNQTRSQPLCAEAALRRSRPSSSTCVTADVHHTPAAVWRDALLPVPSLIHHRATAGFLRTCARWCGNTASNAPQRPAQPLLTTHPHASGFWGARGPQGCVPSLYSALQQGSTAHFPARPENTQSDACARGTDRPRAARVLPCGFGAAAAPKLECYRQSAPGTRRARVSTHGFDRRAHNRALSQVSGCPTLKQQTKHAARLGPL